MTLGEGKKKVLLLIDEYSSGGTVTPDKDIDTKMNDFFDLAQKNVAGYKKIVRSFLPARPAEADGAGSAAAFGSGVLCPAPENFGQVFRVWRDGRLTARYPWVERCILLPEADVGLVAVEYFAVPAAITAETPDDHLFEVEEDAAACMPFFVAAQQLVVDLILDPAPLLELYDRMLSTLDTRPPESGGGGVRQTLYRGRPGRRL